MLQGGRGCNGEDGVQNTPGGIANDSDCPETSIGRCGQDGSNVASVTSWLYAESPCTGGGWDNQVKAALAAVLATGCTESICANDVS